ncbi:hypothetical protein FRC06_008407, partial [Ceratobasidium sp. 370]
VRLGGVPVSAVFYSTSVTPSGPHELAVLSLLPGGPEPSRPSSAVAPIRGYTNRISTSATSPPFPLPTLPAGLVPLADGHAPDDEGLSLAPVTIDHAPMVPPPMAPPLPVAVADSGEGVLSVPPANTDGELLSGPPVVITVEPTVLDSVASESLPRRRNSTTSRGYCAYIRSSGHLPGLINEYDISPSELRSSIELVIRTRQSVYGTPVAESGIASAQGEYSLFLHLN